MAIPEKTFTSSLPELMASLFGTKGTQSQTATANTGPLQGVVDAAMKPMDQQLYEQLIASISGTAAQQVPQLTAALANATGGRTSNNSPLALALNEQNNKAMADAAAAIMGYNQRQLEIAANAAGGIANATRSVNSKTTTGQPAINPLLMTAGGWLLNKADKKGLFDFLKDSPTSSAALPAMGSAPSLLDFGGGTLLSSMPSGGSIGTNGGGNFFDFGGMLGGGFDAAPSFDFGNFFGGSSGTDFGFGDVFSLGGGGGASAPSLDELWSTFDFGSSLFADGGTVGRNRVQMGEAPVAQGTAAMTATPEQLAQLLMMAAQAQQGQMQQMDPLESEGTPGIGRDPTEAENARTQEAIDMDAQGGYSGRNQALGGLALAVLGMMAPAMAAPISVGQRTGVLPSNPLSMGSMMQKGFSSIFDGVTGAAPTTGYAAIDSAQFGTADAPVGGSSTAGESGFGTGVPMADGGKIRGAGTGTSDSVPAKNKTPGGKPIAVSNGEFIVSADAVSFYGEDFFKRLNDAVHTPVRR